VGQRPGAVHPVLDYDLDIRSAPCSTNAVEWLNARYRRPPNSGLSVSGQNTVRSTVPFYGGDFGSERLGIATRRPTVRPVRGGVVPVASAMTAVRRGRVSSFSAGAIAARLGLVARGVIYLLIGWVALMLAAGRSNQEADQRGALQTLAQRPAGAAMLWSLVVGFAAYALWRVSEVIGGARGEGNKIGPRIASGFRGVAYAFLAFTTVSVVRGSKSSQASTQQDATARIMQHPGGRWTVGLVDGVVLVIGVGLAVGGVRRTFAKKLNTTHMSEHTRRKVLALGAIGTTARGIVFALAGGLVIDAARTFDPAKARGLDEALRTLRDQREGAFLLGLTAAGLIIFGVYGLCEARWRRV
jgi:Domain of Unknown Function (DUF1206)